MVFRHSVRIVRQIQMHWLVMDHDRTFVKNKIVDFYTQLIFIHCSGKNPFVEIEPVSEPAQKSSQIWPEADPNLTSNAGKNLLIVKTSLLRETSKHLNRTLTTERKFDWRPKFEFLPFEVNNQTKPFRFNYDPIKQENFIKRIKF